MARRRTKQEIFDACRESGGIPMRVVRSLGVDYSTYYDWLKRYPELNAVMDEAHNAVTQQAEDVVQSAIANGDTQVARWWLSRRDNRFTDKTRNIIEGVNGNISLPVSLDDSSLASLQDAMKQLMGAGNGRKTQTQHDTDAPEESTD